MSACDSGSSDELKTSTSATVFCTEKCAKTGLNVMVFIMTYLFTVMIYSL